MKYKRQKILLINKIFFIFSIVFLIFQLKWQNELENNTQDILNDLYFGGFLLFFIISLIIYICIGGYLGTGLPNNFKEIKMSLIRWDNISELNVNQISKGVWKINNNIIFDIKWWIFQRRYIYEVICMSLILYQFNKTNGNYIHLFGRRKYENDIIIRFVNNYGKVKEKNLVKKNVIKKTLGIQKRIIFSADSTGQGLSIKKLFNHEELSLKRFFK